MLGERGDSETGAMDMGKLESSYMTVGSVKLRWHFATVQQFRRNVRPRVSTPAMSWLGNEMSPQAQMLQG